MNILENTKFSYYAFLNFYLGLYKKDRGNCKDYK